MFISHVCQAVRILVTTAEVAKEVDAVMQEADYLRGATLVTRSSLLALDIFDLVSSLRGKENVNQKMKVKQYEYICRLVDVPITIAKEFRHTENSLSGIVPFIEKGVLRPFVSLFRTVLEKDLLQEKKYRDLSPEDRKKTLRPIYKVDEKSGKKNLEYKEIDIKECEQNIKEIEESLKNVKFAECMTHTNTIENIYKMFAARLLAKDPLNGQNGDQVAFDDLFTLRRLKRIPPEFHDDQIFGQHTCAITLEPVRFPVSDPTTNNRAVYEKSAIEAWLQNNPTSPLSRSPLHPAQLIARRDLQTVIERRLDFHETQLRAAIQNSLEAPQE